MPTITRRIEFDAGHRVLYHESKCANLHGHRYVAEVSVSAPELDRLGRVIDFSVLKAKVGAWVDHYWDHNILLHQDDPLVSCWHNDLKLLNDCSHKARDVFGPKEPFIVPGKRNPTAEVLAELLFDKAQELLKSDGITVERVCLYETPNCWTDYPAI